MYEQQLASIGPAPLSDQAHDALLDAIIKKRFVGRLPNESELATTLGVSRTTVRAALQSLEQEGVVSRRRAIGTTINEHVRPSALALQRLVRFSDLLRADGYAVAVTSDMSRATRHPSQVAAEFPSELPDGDVIITNTHYRANEELAISISDLVPCSHLSEPDKIPDQHQGERLDLARPYLTERVDHATVELAARAQDSLLDLPPGQPFLRLLERHHSQGGAVLAWSVIDSDSDFVRFTIARR